MARKKKVFDKNGPFQTRFRNLFNETKLTQEQLANALDVQRPTLIGWLDGRTLPDIESLDRIARHFEVSADYLLGFSETKKPDANMRAVMEYTGLSERAVDVLHDSLSNTDELKRTGSSSVPVYNTVDLALISDMICSPSMQIILSHMTTFRRTSLIEEKASKGFELLRSSDGYIEDRMDERYQRAVNACSDLLSITRPGIEKCDADHIASSFTPKELLAFLIGQMTSARETRELSEYHASKAFGRLIESVTKSDR